jgi:hypothetical protein
MSSFISCNLLVALALLATTAPARAERVPLGSPQHVLKLGLTREDWAAAYDAIIRHRSLPKIDISCKIVPDLCDEALSDVTRNGASAQDLYRNDPIRFRAVFPEIYYLLRVAIVQDSRRELVASILTRTRREIRAQAENVSKGVGIVGGISTAYVGGSDDDTRFVAFVRSDVKGDELIVSTYGYLLRDKSTSGVEGKRGSRGVSHSLRVSLRAATEAGAAVSLNTSSSLEASEPEAGVSRTVAAE